MSDTRENKLKLLKQVLKTDHLNKEERKNILELVSNYIDLFHLDGGYLTYSDTVTHKINTPSLTKPINIRPYRLPTGHTKKNMKNKYRNENE